MLRHLEKYELSMNPADLGRQPIKDICSNCEELTGRESDLKGARKCVL